MKWFAAWEAVYRLEGGVQPDAPISSLPPR